MNPNWAEENLQTIRTLMERSALYRRALAPVMMLCGIFGLVGGFVGWQWQLNSREAFMLVWFITAATASGCSMLLVRQQSLRESEAFWSPPTRRVAQALTPAFLVGAVLAAVLTWWGNKVIGSEVLILIWCFSFGCGLHSASFFMPRGTRWFSWAFLIIGFILLINLGCNLNIVSFFHSPHLFMAAIFGGLHLAYGIYLHFTEKKTTA